MKRLLNCTASEKLAMNKEELKQSILACEGRVIMTETVVACPPLLGDLTNAELAASFGSDMILLNVFDCDNPVINGLPACDNPVALLKKLVGRPVGCNLEPIDLDAQLMEERLEISHGRHATVETFKKAKELGFDFICLTGNPGTGVSNSSIEKAISLAKEHFGGMIIAGKMHSAGIDEPLVDLDAIPRLIDAGADIIMLDNMTHEQLKEAIEYIDGRAEVEVSGNVTRENIAKLTDLGVDYISSGALTHSSPIMDISLKNLHAV